MSQQDALRVVMAVSLALLGYWLFGSAAAVLGGIAGVFLAGPVAKHLPH